MTTFCALMLTLSLLVLAATRGCSGQDNRTLEYQEITHNTKEERFTQVLLESLVDNIQIGLLLHRQNSDALKDLHALPDTVMLLKEQINTQNENINSLKNEVAALHRVDVLTQENEDLKTQLQNESQKVSDLEEKLAESRQQVRNYSDNQIRLNSTVQDLDKRLEVSQSRVEELEHLVKQLQNSVQEFRNNQDWGELRRGLESVLDNSTKAYIQLQGVRYEDFTPLWRVGYENYAELASLLLCAGLPVDMADSDDDNMLTGAARNGHVQLVKLLLEHGAEINRRGSDRNTPLMTAAFWGQLQVVKLLVENGADTTARESRGRTSLQLARLSREKEVAEYLEQLPH